MAKGWVFTFTIPYIFAASIADSSARYFYRIYWIVIKNNSIDKCHNITYFCFLIGEQSLLFLSTCTCVNGRRKKAASATFHLPFAFLLAHHSFDTWEYCVKRRANCRLPVQIYLMFRASSFHSILYFSCPPDERWGDEWHRTYAATITFTSELHSSQLHCTLTPALSLAC